MKKPNKGVVNAYKMDELGVSKLLWQLKMLSSCLKSFTKNYDTNYYWLVNKKVAFFLDTFKVIGALAAVSQYQPFIAVAFARPF